MASSISAADVIADWGAYYIKGGQNEKDLYTQIFQPSITTKYATPIITEDDVYRSVNVELSEIVQGFQHKWTPKGDGVFKPNEIILREIKIDKEIYPDKVVGSWLGFLRGMGDVDRKNWPLIRWYIEKVLIPGKNRDMEKSVYFNGQYVVPTEGTASAASAAMNGIKYLIDQGIDNTADMNEVNLDAPVTASNIVQSVEEFTNQIDQELSTLNWIIAMSPSNAKAYYRDKRDTFGDNIDYKAANGLIDFSDLDGGSQRIVSLPSMAGSDYIWATPVANFLHVTKPDVKTPFKPENVDRLVKMYTDWKEGIGFGYNPLVYAYRGTGSGSGSASVSGS